MELTNRWNVAFEEIEKTLRSIYSKSSDDATYVSDLKKIGAVALAVLLFIPVSCISIYNKLFKGKFSPYFLSPRVSTVAVHALSKPIHPSAQPLLDEMIKTWPEIVLTSFEKLGITTPQLKLDVYLKVIDQLINLDRSASLSSLNSHLRATCPDLPLESLYKIAVRATYLRPEVFTDSFTSDHYVFETLTKMQRADLLKEIAKVNPRAARFTYLNLKERNSKKENPFWSAKAEAEVVRAINFGLVNYRKDPNSFEDRNTRKWEIHPVYRFVEGSLNDLPLP